MITFSGQYVSDLRVKPIEAFLQEKLIKINVMANEQSGSKSN